MAGIIPVVEKFNFLNRTVAVGIVYNVPAKYWTLVLQILTFQMSIIYTCFVCELYAITQMHSFATLLHCVSIQLRRAT